MKNSAQHIGCALFSETVYPRRSLLRCGLDTVCSISQSIQTMAAPRLMTTLSNTNVRAGAVSMFGIPDVMQAAYQQTECCLGVYLPCFLTSARAMLNRQSGC
jgi:hypothetical protein